MDFIILLLFLVGVTSFLAYRFEVLDYFIYIVSLLAMLMAVVVLAFLKTYWVSLGLAFLSMISAGGFFLYRHIKHY